MSTRLAAVFSRTGSSLLLWCATVLLTACGGGGSDSSSMATVPVISAQPQNATVVAGQTAIFSVTASGTAPLSYQWQRNGTSISAATAASYTTLATTVSDNGAAFAVVVTNSAGTVTSSSATLTVTSTAPTISAQPQNAIIGNGASATFSATASGTPPLTYQWQKNGVNISAATSASFMTPAASAADSGSQYAVVVSGVGGSVASSAATLAVVHTLGLIAGKLGGLGHTDAVGVAATFYGPAATATDSAGNVYVADSSNNTIRKITSAGVVTTFAGTAGVTGSADGTGAAAQFNAPAGVAVDAAGNVYIADTNNDTIRKITAGGVVTTLAGTAGAFGFHDATGAAANFAAPSGIAADSLGNLYVADTDNSVVRKIVIATAVVTTLAGTADVTGFVDGTGVLARFNAPSGVAADGLGNLYVADTNNSTIRKVVVSTGVVTTLAGTAETFGAADGIAGAALFNAPTGVALDSTGAHLFVADTSNETVRVVTTASGAVTTLAGSAGAAGSIDGTGAAARFSTPVGVSSDASGDLFVADSDTNLIRKIASGAVVTTFAGNIGGRGYLDGTAGTTSTALFNDPHNVSLGPSGSLYIADQGNNVIRKMTSGLVTTFAGSSGAAGVGSANGTGASAQFNQPFGMAIDSHGNLFVADSANNTIRMITPAAVVSTFAGTAGVTGALDGTGANAQFNQPLGIALDTSDDVYVADCGNQTVRKITPAGVVTTFAGTAGVTGSADGSGTAATFNCPHGLAVDSTANVYVADRFNDTIRKITPAGVVTTIAGTAGLNDFVDGSGAAAHFWWPGELALDSSGNLYVTDFLHNAVRKITSAGVVTTVVGYAPNTSPAPVGALLGALPGALSGPSSIVVVPGSTTQLVVSDALENALLLATLP